MRPITSDSSSLRVLMTGATGFVGRQTLEALLRRGHRVLALARTPETLPQRPDGQLSVLRGDLSRLRDPSLELSPCDVVLHLAAATRPHEVEEYDRVNRLGTRDLVACLARQSWRPNRLVFASSLAAAGPSPPGRPLTEEDASNPCEPYGESKLAAEDILKSAPFACTLLRAPAVFGPDSPGLTPLFRWSRSGFGVLAGGAQPLSFVHVDDFAEALTRATVEKRDEVHLYYVAHRRPTDLRELWQLAAACHGRRIRLVSLHRKWLTRAASLAGRLPSAVLSPDARIQLGQLARRAGENFVCDPTRFERAMKWRARIGVEESMRLSFRGTGRGRGEKALRLAAVLIAMAAWLVSTPPASSAAENEREAWVREGLERNYQGDYEGAREVWAKLRAETPRHPAADIHEVDTLYWLVDHAPAQTRWDDEITRLSTRAISLSEALLEADADDLDARFYLAQAQIHVARMEAMRGSPLTAGARGERARANLEHVLAELPEAESSDPKFALGLYYYFAASLPQLLTWLNWLWFIPSGDRDLGLAYLEDARRGGDVFRTAATLTLAGIYARYEERTEDAVALFAPVRARYPGNAYLHSQWVGLLVLSGEYAQAREQALALESRSDLAPNEELLSGMVTIWRARAELGLGESALAKKTMETLERSERALPRSAEAWRLLMWGYLLQADGDREAARSRYRAVLSLKSPEYDSTAKGLAEKALEGGALAPAGAPG